MGKTCRLKFRTKSHKKRKGFCKKKLLDDVNNVIRTVNNVNNTGTVYTDTVNNVR